MDYRGLNNLIIKDWYFLLLICESLDWLGRVKKFTQLDFTSVYHQIRIWESNKWKMAFHTRYGHLEYQVMSFSLSNAPANFQGYINKIFVETLGIFVIVYLDDILIYTKDSEQSHIETVHWVLK